MKKIAKQIEYGLFHNPSPVFSIKNFSSPAHFLTLLGSSSYMVEPTFIGVPLFPLCFDNFF